MADNTQQKQQKPGFWDYATPILTGMGAAAVTGAYNNYAVRKQNQFNAEQAQINRDYETQMSNTAYQRAYADMDAAGLNPHLAGGQGGASSPAGTAATGAQAMPLDVAGAVNAAANAAMTRAQMENLKANTNLTEKQSGKTEAERKYTENKTELETALNEAEIEYKQAQTKDAKEAAKQKIAATINQTIQNVYEAKYGRKMPANMLDHVGTRVMGMAMESGGSMTGLEYLIENEIDEYEKNAKGRETRNKLNKRDSHNAKSFLIKSLIGM